MMNRLSTICLILLALFLAAAPLQAQNKPRVSPHETVSSEPGGQ